jgi:hypothetical protein
VQPSKNQNDFRPALSLKIELEREEGKMLGSFSDSCSVKRIQEFPVNFVFWFL